MLKAEAAPFDVAPWLVEARWLGSGELDEPPEIGPRHPVGRVVFGLNARLAAGSGWPGLFVAHCFRVADRELVLPRAPARAASWAGWGLDCPPQFGAVMVFGKRERGTATEVGFYLSEDREGFHIVSCSGPDTVAIARPVKSRLLACRWPEGRRQTGQRLMREAASSGAQ